MLIGELLSREERFAAYGPQAVFDLWTTCVVPKSVSRSSGRVVPKPPPAGPPQSDGEREERIVCALRGRLLAAGRAAGSSLQPAAWGGER